ncbi:MAG: hypothetical protein AB8G05_10710 [Oligoflexales bacterium]
MIFKLFMLLTLVIQGTACSKKNSSVIDPKNTTEPASEINDENVVKIDDTMANAEDA